MNYHQLTQQERYQIEAGIALGLSIREPAPLLYASEDIAPIFKKYP